MSSITNYLEEFGKAFIPKNMRPGLGKYLAKAEIDEVPYKFFGILFMMTLAITYFIYVPVIYPFAKDKAPLIFFIITFVSWVVIQLLLSLLITLSIYFYLNIRIYQRTSNIKY